LILVAVVVSALASGIGGGSVVKPEGASSFLDFFRAAAEPRLDGEFLALTANAALTTLAYAALGTALSLVIGMVGGVASSQTWWYSRGRGRVGWVITRALLVLPRGVHEVVWGLFFLAVFGLDPIVAVLAIGIPFGAITAPTNTPPGQHTTIKINKLPLDKQNHGVSDTTSGGDRARNDDEQFRAGRRPAAPGAGWVIAPGDATRSGQRRGGCVRGASS
jgi:hypothetical protein